MLELLFKEDEILKNHFLLLFKSFAIWILLVEAIQKVLDHDDEIVADIDPFSRNLSVSSDALDDLYK